MKFRSLYVSLLILSVSFMFQGCQQRESVDTFEKEYVHVVYFWLNNPDNAGDRNTFETALKEFLDHSDYAKTNFIGIPPKAKRDVVDDSFTYNLVVSFESAEAQEKYQEEAVHKKFIEEASHLWNKVIVYDAIPTN